MSYHDLSFEAMGCQVRLLIGEPLPGAAPAAEAAERGRAFIEEFDSALSRFREQSELSQLNRDPAETVVASPLLRAAVRAGLWAAERTGGLVDPTLAGAIVEAGYDESLVGVEPASLADALAAAPLRRPAGPSPRSGWREFTVDDEAGAIRRPRGVLFDTGGTGKGLAADMVAERILRGYSRFVVDCGGDVRAGGFAAQIDPFAIHARHPIDREPACVFQLSGGGIATSGIDVRIWRREDGSYAHHLLDPSTGEPVWSGLIGVTAIGRTALEAETLSKQALLSGPEPARELLASQGGMLIGEDGTAELVGSVDAKLIGRRSASVATETVKLAGVGGPS